MNRIATFPQYQLALGHALQSQRSVLDLQIQISSGKVSRDYAGIAGDAHTLVNLETAHARARQYIKNNDTVNRRLQTMETNIAAIFDGLSTFRVSLISALNANNGEDLAIAEEATHLKQEIANLLNVKQDGRYLFAGSRTDTKPVELTGWTPPVMPLTPPLDTYEDEYYRGDQVKLSVEADADLTVTYGITADEPAFEYALRAMHYVELAGNPPDRDTLQVALALVNTALGTEEGNADLGVDPITHDIADLRTLVGASMRSLDSTTKRLDEFMLYTEQTIGDIENVDPAAAIARLATYETQLQASYMTLTRLSQLTLVNFLR